MVAVRQKNPAGSPGAGQARSGVRDTGKLVSGTSGPGDRPAQRPWFRQAHTSWPACRTAPDSDSENTVQTKTIDVSLCTCSFGGQIKLETFSPDNLRTRSFVASQ